MHIVKFDNRPALTVVLALAKAEEDARVSIWQKEIEVLTIESTKNFVGVMTKASVEKGLKIVIGCASLSLVHSTGGGVDPVRWLETLRSKGISFLVKQTISLVKDLTLLPEYELVWDRENFVEPRKLLLDFVLKSGYGGYTQNRDQRLGCKCFVDFAHWLIEFGGETVEGFKHREQRGGSADFTPMAENIIYPTLVRVCKGLPFKARVSFEIQKHLSFRGKKKTEAKKRYDAFVATVPKHLRPALFYEGRDWWERFVE